MKTTEELAQELAIKMMFNSGFICEDPNCECCSDNETSQIQPALKLLLDVARAEPCENCNDTGWFGTQSSSGAPEQIQCQCLYFEGKRLHAITALREHLNKEGITEL